MKKVILTTIAMLFALTATTTFTSCDDKKPEIPTGLTVIATDVGGAIEGITRVNAVYVNTVGFVGLEAGTEQGDAFADSKAPAATANFTNRSFSISVPLELTGVTLATVKKADLKGLAEMSVESFGMTQLQFQGCKGEQKTGLICNKTKDGLIESVLYYSDTALTIKGEGKSEKGNEYVYNMTIVKGWNRYFIKTETISGSGEGKTEVAEHKKFTIQTPAFTKVTLGWQYDADKAQ